MTSDRSSVTFYKVKTIVTHCSLISILAAIPYTVANKSCSGNGIVDYQCLQASSGFVNLKCRCPSDQCGRRVFAIHEHAKTDTCAFYIHQRHICACTKPLMIHTSLFSRSQTRNFVECNPGPHKKLKCRI